MGKIELENPKIKVVRNGWGKFRKCVLRRFGKSLGAWRTCPDLPPAISDNFNFWVFTYIFDNFERFVMPKLTILGRLRHEKNSAAQ